jgi:hypothetical protein
MSAEPGFVAPFDRIITLEVEQRHLRKDHEDHVQQSAHVENNLRHGVETVRREHDAKLERLKNEHNQRMTAIEREQVGIVQLVGYMRDGLKWVLVTVGAVLLFQAVRFVFPEVRPLVTTEQVNAPDKK